MHRALALAAHARRAPRPQPAGRLRPARRRPGPRWGRASTAAPAPRTPRSTRWPRPGTTARGATAVVTLEPCDHTGRTGPCTEALLAAGVVRVVFAQSDTNPAATGWRRHAARRRRRRRGRAAGGGGAPAQPGLDLRPRARPAVRHLEARHHPGRPQRRRRRQQPLGLQPGREARHPPAAGRVRRDPGRHRDGRGRRPAADRARRGRRAAAAPAAAGGDGGAGPPRRPAGLRRRRRDAPAAHPGPARRPLRARRPRPAARLPRGRAHARRRVPGRRRGRRGRGVRRADAARRAAAPPWPTSASPPSPTRSTCPWSTSTCCRATTARTPTYD